MAPCCPAFWGGRPGRQQPGFQCSAGGRTMQGWHACRGGFAPDGQGSAEAPEAGAGRAWSWRRSPRRRRCLGRWVKPWRSDLETSSPLGAGRLSLTPRKALRRGPGVRAPLGALGPSAWAWDQPPGRGRGTPGRAYWAVAGRAPPRPSTLLRSQRCAGAPLRLCRDARRRLGGGAGAGAKRLRIAAPSGGGPRTHLSGRRPPRVLVPRCRRRRCRYQRSSGGSDAPGPRLEPLCHAMLYAANPGIALRPHPHALRCW